MPQLKSGRHVAVVPIDLPRLVLRGNEPAIYGRIIAFRLAVHKPEDLVPLLPIAYFNVGEDDPSELIPYHSGLRVSQIRAGQGDWTAEELEEFDSWLATHPPLREWCANAFEDINAQILNHPIWNSPFILDD